MSPKHSSLAYDETTKEFSGSHFDNDFEPELSVIVNAYYSKTPMSLAASEDVIQIHGRITVSF